MRDELRGLARNLAETAELGSGGQRAAERIATEDVALDALLGPTLDGDRASVEREASRLGIDADALAQLAGMALQPFLWEAAAQLSALTDIDRWDRGFCPVCGAWPGLAELVGPERHRALRCIRCGTSWSWFVLLCPFCGNDDHRTLRMLQEEGSGQRVDVCERCHGYVKAITSYAPIPAPRVIAEDVATAELDVVAQRQGYRHPGDVDVTTAGIPRLAREGRTPRQPQGGST